jgi:hypothetical protein
VTKFDFEQAFTRASLQAFLNKKKIFEKALTSLHRYAIITVSLKKRKKSLNRHTLNTDSWFVPVNFPICLSFNIKTTIENHHLNNLISMSMSNVFLIVRVICIR